MNNKKWIKPASIGIVVLFLLFVPLVFQSPYQIHILIMSGISVMLASSLRFIANSGQLSLGHGGMMSIGAYTSTLLLTKLGLNFWACFFGAGIAAGLLGLLVGFPFTRIKGVYFGVVTIFLSQVITLVIQQWRGLTNGNLGIIMIPAPQISIPGVLNIDFSSKIEFYYFILILIFVSLAIFYAIEKSRVGISFFSIKQSESLAESVGINTTKYKILAFSIGCFFAGLTGSFYAEYITAITPNVFGFIFTVYVVAYMIVGGRKSFVGPIIGAVLLSILSEVFRGAQQFQPFVLAALLVGVMFFMPEGVVGLPVRIKTAWQKRKSHA
jgi:branched-chain amino acid transport system permease protein